VRCVHAYHTGIIPSVMRVRDDRSIYTSIYI
jgi:hypothetical protein